MTTSEIQALAEALAPLVAQHLRSAEETQLDADFFLSKPLEERQKIQREKRRRQVAGQKARGKSR